MPHTGEQWRLNRRPALDGVRGVACLLVLGAHMVISETIAFIGGGGAGVTVFFTLSGFLITALLLEERDRNGRTNLRAFYTRRIRRLLPALVVYVAVVLALSLYIGPWYANVRGALWSLFYVSNWHMIDGGTLGALSQTWSLAIEEQFYVVWPLILIAVLWRASETVLLAGTFVAIAGSIYQSFTLWDDAAGLTRMYFGSDTRASAILAGCAAAMVARRLGAGTSRPWVATGLVLAVVPLGFVRDSTFTYVWLPVVTAALVATALVLGTRGTWTGWLAHPALVWVGQRSYGLYLWHYAAVTALAGQMSWFFWSPAYLAWAFVGAMLSWRYVEQPFLARREAGRRSRAVASST